MGRGRGEDESLSAHFDNAEVRKAGQMKTGGG
jgi:hypothetical protein